MQQQPPNDPLEQALLNISVPDTHVIQQAELALKHLLKGKQSLPRLAHLLLHSPHAAVRQLCAVLLRVKVNQHWIKLARDEQQLLKTQLLQSLALESVRLVRLNVCYVVAALSKHHLDQWPELLRAIGEATSAASAEVRELGFVLLFTMAESVATAMPDRFPALCDMYVSALQSEREPKVRTAALRAAASLVEAASQQDAIKVFEPLVLPLISSALAEPDEDTAVQVVEVRIWGVAAEALTTGGAGAGRAHRD
jgi:hypothetical protein